MIKEAKISMTLNQLIYFQKVATLENYHQAAEILYVSQPSLSRSMAALEIELGITLFKKVRRFLENKENSKLYHFKGKQYLN